VEREKMEKQAVAMPKMRLQMARTQALAQRKTRFTHLPQMQKTLTRNLSLK
jgi:hypothetical protein